MPANLPPDYFEAEERYRRARSTEEKLVALREMLAIIPKHKGTEKIQADIKRRMAKLRQQPRKRQKPSRSTIDHIEREGAGQVALIGLPNSGKSTILAAVTNACPEIADYPFSTLKPLLGMMRFEDIQIQLVDLPPLSAEYTEPWVFNIIRYCDLALLVMDLSNPSPEKGLLEALEILEEANIHLAGEHKGSETDQKTMIKKAVIIGAKLDVNDARLHLRSLTEACREEFLIVPISVKTGEGLEEMGRVVFDALGIIRIYTKQPGKKPDLAQPYVLPKGSTILDVAETIHRDFVEKLKYVRIWGSGKFDGQQVQRDHVVEDGDVIEIHL